MPRLWPILAILLLEVSPLFATTVVATPTGSGTNTGVDWAHACAGFTGNCAWSALNRGDTLWFGGGSTHYAGQGTMSQPESGTGLITIQGATASIHGPATGWTNSLGVDSTPAIWDMNAFSSIAGNNFVTLRTGYWIINGSVASDPTNPATYGIQFAHPDCTHDYIPIFYGDSSGQTIDHVNIQYPALDMSGCGTASIARRLVDGGAQGQRTNNTVSHWYCNGCQNGVTIRNPPGTTSDGDVIEYGYSVNSFDDTTHHGTCVTMFGTVTNVTIRYNKCANITGTGGILAETVGGAGGAIYGNLLGADNCVPTCNNGIIAVTSDSYMTGMHVYNNALPNSAAGEPWWQGCISGNPTQCAAATGNVLENNIIWNQDCALVGGDNPTHDHNSYLSCLDTAPTETGGQVANLNPFINAGLLNFALAIDTSAWTPLSSPYNVDITGATITSSRGPYQFVAFQSGTFVPSGVFSGVISELRLPDFTATRLRP